MGCLCFKSSCLLTKLNNQHGYIENIYRLMLRPGWESFLIISKKCPCLPTKQQKEQPSLNFTYTESQNSLDWKGSLEIS